MLWRRFYLLGQFLSSGLSFGEDDASGLSDLLSLGRLLPRRLERNEGHLGRWNYWQVKLIGVGRARTELVAFIGLCEAKLWSKKKHKAPIFSSGSPLKGSMLKDKAFSNLERFLTDEMKMVPKKTKSLFSKHFSVFLPISIGLHRDL